VELCDDKCEIRHHRSLMRSQLGRSLTAGTETACECVEKREVEKNNNKQIKAVAFRHSAILEIG